MVEALMNDECRCTGSYIVALQLSPRPSRWRLTGIVLQMIQHHLACYAPLTNDFTSLLQDVDMEKLSADVKEPAETLLTTLQDMADMYAVPKVILLVTAVQVRL